MAAKLKGNFVHINYNINFFRKLQNLRKRDLIVKDYIEEFYKLAIRSSHSEDGGDVVDKYINGLKYEIQDKLGVLRIKSM